MEPQDSLAHWGGVSCRSCDLKLLVTMVVLPATLVVTLRLNRWNTVWLTQINLSPQIGSSIHSAINTEPPSQNMQENM